MSVKWYTRKVSRTGIAINKTHGPWHFSRALMFVLMVFETLVLLLWIISCTSDLAFFNVLLLIVAVSQSCGRKKILSLKSLTFEMNRAIYIGCIYRLADEGRAPLMNWTLDACFGL